MATAKKAAKKAAPKKAAKKVVTNGLLKADVNTSKVWEK